MSLPPSPNKKIVKKTPITKTYILATCTCKEKIQLESSKHEIGQTYTCFKCGEKWEITPK